MNFQEKRIKIQTLQKKATEFNKKEDALIDIQGMDPVQARRELQYEETNHGRTTKIEQYPYLDNENINGVGKLTSLGFKNTHKTSTTYNASTVKIHNQFEEVKEMRKSEQLKTLHHQQEVEQNDENKQRVNFYTKDHVSQLFDGVKNDPKKTSYQDHDHNAEKEKVIINANLKYHNKKNDINVFTDAFVKHKKTMRK